MSGGQRCQLMIAALTITVVGPEFPLGAGETRRGALCFCGRGVPYNVTACPDCGYVVPWARRLLEERRRAEVADDLGIRLL